MELFKLFGSILVDSDAAEKSISKTGDKADGMGKKLGKGIKTAAVFGAALVAGAAAAGAGMFALGVKLGDTADAILDLNSITGMSTDSVQEWRKVAEVAGIGADSMTNASKKLTKSLDIMSTGTGKGAESLEKLGFSFKEIEGMSADERLNALTEALAGVDDKTERARIGTDLFGGSWAEIAPAVDLGAEAMQKAKDSANIISNDDLVKANEFRIKVENMKDQLGFFVTKITIALLPALSTMMTWFGEKMPAIEAFVKTAFDNAGEAVKIIGQVFENDVKPKIQAFTDWLEPKLPAIKAAFETAFAATKKAIEDTSVAIQDASKWFKEHWSILEPILAGIAGGAIAFYAITGAIALYNAALLFSMGLGPIYIAMTAGMTAVTTGFASVLAFLLSPVFLVVAAIAAVIAIGVLLWRNWDTIVIKAKALGVFLSATFNHIKTVVVQKVMEMVTGAINKFNELKTKAIVKFAEILAAAGTKFNAIKSAIMDPINAAKDKVKAAVDKIKGFFTGMKLNLPKIKVPSFKLKNWSKNPLDWIGNMPSIGINWNAKGALFTKPTVFNTPMGLQGFGEAGPEAALPLNSSVLGMIGQKISDTMGMQQNQQIVITPAPIYLDGQKLTEITFQHNQLLFGSASAQDAFFNGVRNK